MNTPPKIHKAKIARLQKTVLAFYRAHGRKLPWRETTDPYAILVSEIMLQQTQVDRVIPKYLAWLATWPTIAHLARARKASVLRAWSGLGYNSRALRLHTLAQIVVRDHHGMIPRDAETLLALPGIGPYSSRSVLIFAFNADLVTIDTNIRRILIHELGLDAKITASDLDAIATQCLPLGHSRDWHNALMDYGSLVKTARATGVKPTSRQSRFKDSARFYRGLILKTLLAQKTLTPRQTRVLFADTKHNPSTIIEGLVAEGLIRRRGQTLMLP